MCRLHSGCIKTNLPEIELKFTQNINRFKFFRKLILLWKNHCSKILLKFPPKIAVSLPSRQRTSTFTATHYRSVQQLFWLFTIVHRWSRSGPNLTSRKPKTPTVLIQNFKTFRISRQENDKRMLTPLYNTVIGSAACLTGAAPAQRSSE